MRDELEESIRRRKVFDAVIAKAKIKEVEESEEKSEKKDEEKTEEDKKE